MQLTYDRLCADELRGTTQADYLIALDAHLQVVENDAVIFDEPAFPVVELARSLLSWLPRAESEDFEFDSMSYEERGTVFIRRATAGWTFGSVLEPDATSTPVELAHVVRCCRRFVDRVATDLSARGIDPGMVIHQ
ncbi:hypothetical protein [Aeromicrobium sp. CnD17-E]|uniref:DUF7878 domain-containing protein n=1 Tax=Aeromicrobium sp. CnD17-E TaxID=2954487 RepID=UPI0020978718|nr:hypothetical protein [Aeromicrobium sp. CnD17-E]MCO7237730.1 hypothetical protein [Aeromicrobium sp. CnD17-E]